MVLAHVLSEALVEAGGALRCLAPGEHFDTYSRSGLRAAASRIPVEIRRGGPSHVGREEIRQLLGRSLRGLPSLKVSTRARWTLNAFSGGYARKLNKAGVLSEFAEEGAYRTLMEGLESFAALMRIAQREDQAINYKMTEGGRRYISARA